MTKFVCTRCSGFYNLDCKLETNTYTLPNRCPFGVVRDGITWEAVDNFPPRPRMIGKENLRPEVCEKP